MNLSTCSLKLEASSSLANIAEASGCLLLHVATGLFVICEHCHLVLRFCRNFSFSLNSDRPQVDNKFAISRQTSLALLNFSITFFGRDILSFETVTDALRVSKSSSLLPKLFKFFYPSFRNQCFIKNWYFFLRRQAKICFHGKPKLAKQRQVHSFLAFVAEYSAEDVPFTLYESSPSVIVKGVLTTCLNSSLTIWNDFELHIKEYWTSSSSVFLMSILVFRFS